MKSLIENLSLQTGASVDSFILAMMLHPEVQRKGQEEISRVCDSSQLPSYGDAASLPYTTAIVLEVLRWAVVAPTGIMFLDLMATGLPRSSSAGVPHYIDTDDIYNGYHIPGQSVVLANSWLALSLVPSKYASA
jgi:hypothetical protein